MCERDQRRIEALKWGAEIGPGGDYAGITIEEYDRLRRVEALARVVFANEDVSPYFSRVCTFCDRVVPEHNANCPWAQLGAALEGENQDA